MSQDLPEAHRHYLQAHVAQIAKLFRAPVITLIVRSPDGGNVKGDLVITNDDPLLVRKALDELIQGKARRLTLDGLGDGGQNDESQTAARAPMGSRAPGK